MDFAGVTVIYINSGAAAALFNRQVTIGTSAVAWIAAEGITIGKLTTLGAASCAVAALVVKTPATGFVDPIAAVGIGLVAGSFCYGAVAAKEKLGDDQGAPQVRLKQQPRSNDLGTSSGRILTPWVWTI
ncbi:ammonium transporter [Desulfosoma caldarium]|uniref:ammonium transporter n=1 Tax=Desulfosoma caldarium TaxID=610254 RepID=UPI0014745341|nr:ammonium transporter [Desulfosoma caldarium]